jgi:hypothetical protein
MGGADGSTRPVGWEPAWLPTGPSSARCGGAAEAGQRPEKPQGAALVVPALPRRSHREQPGELSGEEVDEAVTDTGVSTVHQVVIARNGSPVLAWSPREPSGTRQRRHRGGWRATAKGFKCGTTTKARWWRGQPAGPARPGTGPLLSRDSGTGRYLVVTCADCTAMEACDREGYRPSLAAALSFQHGPSSTKPRITPTERQRPWRMATSSGMPWA